MQDNRDSLVEYILAQQARYRKVHIELLSEELLNANLTIQQIKVLFLLYASDSSSMGQLASQLRVKLPTVTGIIDRLVEQGIVKRSEHPQDRRLVIIELTDTGYELADRLNEAAQMHMSRFLERLTLEELNTMSRAIDIMYKVAVEEKQALENHIELDKEKRNN
jgi:DNA-binding MarR family transcriptional regulator